MIARFIGTHTNKIDEKGRVSVPSPFRRVLAEGNPTREDGKPPSFFMVIDPNEGLIECVSVDRHESLAQRIDAIEDDDLQAAMEYRYFNCAHLITLDANGRIQVSPSMREIVGDAEALAFAGENQRFRIVAAKPGERPFEDAYEEVKARLADVKDIERMARRILR